jgi:heptaprenyl diphosphate synthase/octaprenyl-diphosphate synthase
MAEAIESDIHHTRAAPQRALANQPRALPAPPPAGHELPHDVAYLFERAHLSSHLAAIEDMMHERVATRSELIAAAGAHTLRAGGKRLRAAMALLAARLGPAPARYVYHAAAAVELIHAASLVHDDLVDATDRRRGQHTVHARWDNDVALMLGDYLFALAAGEMARCHDQRITSFYAQAVQTIVVGELHPVTDVAPTDEAIERYLHKAGAKTAALFEAACKAGMASGGGSDDDIAALGRYGYDIGLAFQIVDDVLDIVGSTQALGKPAGNDLRQGTITLPLIYAASSSPFLRDIAGQPGLSDSEVADAIREIIRLGGVRRAQEDAAHIGQRARAHLEGFAPSLARQTLLDLAQFVLYRCS